MQLRLTVLLILSLSSKMVEANWLCKEASSLQQGNTFYACGYSKEESLSNARENALEAAKREFKSFCNESEDCRNNAYTISPMRTDCIKEENEFSCYRGLEYTILPQKRSSMKIDKREISKQIKEKDEELKELEDQLKMTKRLEDLNNKVEQLKKVDSTEAELEYLKHIKSDYPSMSFRAMGIKLSGNGTSLKEDNTTDADNVSLAGIGFEFKYQMWKKIGLKLNVSYLTGDSEADLNDRGSPNTTSKKVFYSHRGFDLGLSFPIVINDYFTISPSVGLVALNYKSLQYQYNNFGIGLNKMEDKENFNSGYWGLGLRLEKSFFIEYEPRQYFKDGKLAAAIHLGYSFEF